MYIYMQAVEVLTDTIAIIALLGRAKIEFYPTLLDTNALALIARLWP